MSHSENNRALLGLDNSVLKFQAGLEQLTEVERYWRSRERSYQFVEAVEKAQAHLELATDALDGPVHGLPFEQNGQGWWSRIVRSLVDYLSLGTGDAVPGEPSHITALEQPDEVGASGRLVLEGHCAVLDLSNLMDLIRAQGMTGILQLNLPHEAVELQFEGGQLVHAFSENTPPGLHLGEVLVAQGAISQALLLSLLEQHKRSPQMIGEILLDGGIVGEKEMQAALHFQIQALFHRIFAVRSQTSFRFRPGLPSVALHRAHVNVVHLLLESARVLDERQAG